MLKKNLGIIVCVAFLFVWLLWPVYQFYALKGQVSFFPWGELDIPDETPRSQ